MIRKLLRQVRAKFGRKPVHWSAPVLEPGDPIIWEVIWSNKTVKNLSAGNPLYQPLRQDAVEVGIEALSERNTTFRHKDER